MTVPRLGFMLAFVTLIVGSTIGVLIQVQLAASHQFLPDAAVGGHASAQVGGYLVLFALSAIEWRLKGAEGVGVAGRVQVALLFIGGILLSIGVLLNIQPLLASFIPLDLVALGIFLARVGPQVLGAAWLEAGSSRHFAIAAAWAIVNLVLTIIFVVALIGAQGDFNKVNTGVLTAADHAIFLGVMTNMFFGLMHDLTPDQRHVMAYTENIIFWVMNVALAGFVITLIVQQQWGEKFFTPFQGAAILVGIVAFSIRLSRPQTPATVTSSMASPV
ncbi:MAG: hypothetical protein QOK05_551 [Chloroflexota bacterium]|nr:hypothetical protein [Chloroflexota bacterium]